MKKVGLLFVLMLSLGFATPTTQVWNPGTDIQAAGSTHLGIDNYFNATSAFSPDVGLTYGVIKGLEVGVDLFYPSPAGPFSFNAKYGLDESEMMPAVAVGINGVGVKSDDIYTDFKQIYAVAAKNVGSIGRFSVGYFTANQNVVGAENTGVILTWDKALTDKVWACVDYASGKSSLGSIFAGVSYTFSPNTSVIFGVGRFNSTETTYATTQLDINI